jgi:hypothetical protein
MTTHRVRERGLSPTRGRFQDLHLVRADESADAASSAPTGAAAPTDEAAVDELLRILHDNVRVWAAHSQHLSTRPSALSPAEEVAVERSAAAPRRGGDLNVQVAAAQKRLLRWLSQTTTGRGPATPLPLRHGERWVALQ